jgi:DNA-binding MarR family transcriptional regulator
MAISEHLEEDIIAALRRIVRAIDVQSRALTEKFGLTGPQLVVLRTIARLEDAGVSAIAREVSLGQSTTSGVLRRLLREGLVQRGSLRKDRRERRFRVTPKGKKLLDRKPSLLQDRFSNELARLEQFEQTQILATLQQIATMMAVEELDAAPILETGVSLDEPRRRK